MEKRKYKLLAFILILSLIFPFFPSAHVSAEGLAFLPDFPYGQDNYYNVNNGSFALWQIHNSNYLTYVQTFTPNNISYPNPIIIFNKTWLASNYTYYLDYTYIIDSWDITGIHINGFAGTQNIRVPNPNSDFVSDNVVYATLLYTTDNVIWKNGTDVGVYAYTNFYPNGYADPTPTPMPDDDVSNPIPNNNLIDNSDLLFLFRVIDENNIYYNQYVGMYIDNMLPWLMSGGEIYLPYFNQSDGGATCIINNGIMFFKISGSNPLYRFYRYGDDLPLASDLNSYLDIVSFNNMVNASWGWSSGGQAFGLQNGSFSLAGNVGTQSLFEIVAFNHTYNDNLIINYDSSITPTPTPTPTTIPTAIPQPTENPNPTATPEPDYKVVVPSDHWWDGLIKPVQYIFVPSQDKMMRTYNIMSEKFGVQKPTKFEFSVDSLVRPDNVVWNFKHVSLNGSDNTETQITLIDFEMIDGWLETSAGRMIIRIIRAVFGLLMWAYLMYIYRKHIATINYTDAETLKDISRNSGGGDEDV